MGWRIIITASLLAASIAHSAVYMNGNAHFNTTHNCTDYFTNGVSAGLPPQPDIAWWKFNESGGSNVVDYSTRGTNNLILNNTAMRLSIPGWFNVLQGHTNGALGYYAYTSNLMNFGTSIVTISFWHYKLRDTSVFPVGNEDRTVFTLGPLSGTNEAVLNSFVDDNAAQLVTFRQDYNADTLSISYNPSYGTWKHYVAAFDLSTTQWLITTWTNGVGGGAAIGDPLTAVDYFSTNTFWLFNDPSLATCSSGLIADFRIYSGLRTNLAEALFTNAPSDCVAGSQFVGSFINTATNAVVPPSDPIVFRGVGLTNNASNASSTTSVTTNAPDANALVICYVINQGSGAEEIPTITGHGMQWVLVATTNNGTVYRISTFRAMTNNTPTADSVVADFGGAVQTACLIRTVQFSGVDTSGTAGSGALAQSVMETTTSANPSLTLGAISDAGNAVYAGFGNERDPFNATSEAGWQQDWDSGADGLLGIYNTVRVGTTDNTVVITSLSSTWVGIAIEVKIAP